MKTPPVTVETAWHQLPPAERLILTALLRLLKGARRSPSPDIARAAANWERCLSFFIKVRLMHQRRRRNH